MVKRIRMRTLLVGGIMTLLFLILLTKMFWVQVIKADFWFEHAKKTWAAAETIPAARGTITDRDGNVLAMDTNAYTVAVNPKLIHQLAIEDEVVEKLHDLLNKPESELREIVTARNDKGEYYVDRQVRPEGWNIDKATADKVTAFKEELKEELKRRGHKKVDDVGIRLLDGSKRYYPKNSLASQVIGYVNKEGNAVIGAEAAFDKELKGQNGHLVYEKDGNRVQIENGNVDYQPAIEGKKIALTIDTEIQYYMEEALKEAYDKYQPVSITAVAADPNTMEILGIANLPGYNPNSYSTANTASFYNHAVGSLYEPGSTFKIVTLAGAVQEGDFNPEEKYMSGSIKVANDPRPIRDIKRDGWGQITFLEGLKRSSNVAFVKLGYERLGREKLMSYIKDFGFGSKTGIELKGESKGIVDFYWPKEVATAAFGQGKVLVTPIQQVAAVAAVANGGKLMEPHIVKQIEDPQTGKTQVTQPKIVRQVISPETSKKVSGYLEQVVADQEIGTGKNAYIKGYRVAGKTGTAQKVINGEYSSDKFVVSFIGYAPVDNPKIVVYVVVDSPNNPVVGGGTVAAPIFKKIVSQSLRHMGVQPKLTASEKQSGAEMTVTVPDLSDLNVSQAAAELKARGLTPEKVGKGTKVIQQIPKSGTVISASQRIYLITEERSKLTVPGMKGLALRDALEVCSLLGIRCLTEGEGYVTAQAAAKLNGEPVIKLTLQPPVQVEAGADGSEASSQNGSRESAGQESGAAGTAGKTDRSDSGNEEAGSGDG
ncbi:penicillin-binding transpeptidase domain-containing protein [Paenibacillus beijingensis]|uniref:Stage V sporulation protein D n=1 Tax=Paenibacillus beijingensis TaxID=1126833 RepID=A0A0D5NM75_9BACL|nr:penicillin-binding transpeptidase domain-containing protein [Paenibacillus beijingensis]AJY76361.1 stage V sporulation protein D [Paenibacillus beijingensis]